MPPILAQNDLRRLAALLPFLSLLGYLAVAAQLNHWFWVGWLSASGCAVYHFLLVRTRNPEQCFQAFNHNNYLGACMFMGIFCAYW